DRQPDRADRPLLRPLASAALLRNTPLLSGGHDRGGERRAEVAELPLVECLLLFQAAANLLLPFATTGPTAPAPAPLAGRPREDRSGGGPRHPLRPTATDREVRAALQRRTPAETVGDLREESTDFGPIPARPNAAAAGRRKPGVRRPVGVDFHLPRR